MQRVTDDASRVTRPTRTFRQRRIDGPRILLGSGKKLLADEHFSGS